MLHCKKINLVDPTSVPALATKFAPVSFRRSGRLAAALLASVFLPLALPGHGLAQTVVNPQILANTPPDDIRPNETLEDRFDRRTTVPGTQVGAVTFQADAVADLGFNDNVFAQDVGKKSDFFADYGAKIDGDYHYDGFHAHLTLNGSQRRYFDLTTENYWQGGARLQTSDQLTQGFGLFLDGGLQRMAVPRTDPNTINGFNPATYLLYDAETGFTLGNGAKNLLTVTAGYNQSIYDQSFGSQGLIITNDRDRQEIYGDVRFDHTFFDQQKVFVEIRPDGREFGRDIDASGFQRASNGVRGDAGFQLDFDSLLLLTVTGGYQTQSYADPRYGTINVPDAIVDALWSPTKLTQLEVKWTHEYYEDIFNESPGYRHDMTVVTLSHELRRDILLKAEVTYDDRQLERSTRHYDILTSEARADYEIARGITVGVDYTNQNLTSNTTRTFNDNIVMLSFKKQF